MGLFGALESLTKATVGTVLVPVDVVRDAVAVVTDEEPDHTERRLSKVKNHFDNALETIDD